MTDPVPSKERIKWALSEWRRLGLSDEWLLNRIYDVAEPSISPESSKDLLSQLRALPAGARLLGYTAAEHIERLETALRGIQSCSTCEACRGAATIALGGDQHNPSPSIRALAESAYKDGYGADLTDDRDLSERTHELIRSLSRPAHEREMPHCVSCSCPPYDEEAIKNG